MDENSISTVDADGFLKSANTVDGDATSAILGTIDPASEAPRKRGRPVGSGRKFASAGSAGSAGPSDGNGDDTRNKSQKESAGKKSPLVVADLSAQLQAIHKMASLVLKNPLIEIDKGEADKLAHSLANVAKHYDFRVNPAVMAWAQLIGVGAAVYGPRVAITIASKKTQKQSAPVTQVPKMSVVSTTPGQMVYQ